MVLSPSFDGETLDSLERNSVVARRREAPAAHSARHAPDGSFNTVNSEDMTHPFDDCPGPCGSLADCNREVARA